jgi:AraC-like DNA-binding protein
MQYVGRTPSPPLDAFIERIWYCSHVGEQTRERVLPGGGTVDLVINLLDDEIRIYDAARPDVLRAHSGAFISGTHTRSFVADPRQRESVIGVHFRPGGAFPFLGISPAELLDAHAPLSDVWGCAGVYLREQLVEAGSVSARFRLLEATLLRRLGQARAGHPAARFAAEALRGDGSHVRVASLASQVGLSHRRFVEVFEREVGVTPKFYARLERFHRVKQRIAALGDPASWATFALSCGYFDQSHMIREFAEFSGMTPASYLRGRDGETMFDHLVHAYSG